MPDPRDPRGVRHALVVVLKLTACAVLAGAASLLAVGKWIADAPSAVLEHLGMRDVTLAKDRTAAQRPRRLPTARPPRAHMITNRTPCDLRRSPGKTGSSISGCPSN
ncbi:transposase family protein [Streptomyces sp. CA-288835]|uniref:transposase family protein n=1 Tax=Streptomyces sp. CA-288835 TaxID=3240069 RepID=UPI003D93E336